MIDVAYIAVRFFSLYLACMSAMDGATFCLASLDVFSARLGRDLRSEFRRLRDCEHDLHIHESAELENNGKRARSGADMDIVGLAGGGRGI